MRRTTWGISSYRRHAVLHIAVAQTPTNNTTLSRHQHAAHVHTQNHGASTAESWSVELPIPTIHAAQSECVLDKLRALCSPGIHEISDMWPVYAPPYDHALGL